MTFRNSDPNCIEHRVAAATNVFEDHGSFIRIVIRSHVQDQHLADDVFQDFFISLISQPLPRGLRNVRGYLYRAITNDIVDATRRIMKYRDYMCKYAKGVSRTKRQKNPEETLLETERANRVFELIEKRLPGAEAEAVSLRYLHSRRVDDIAKTMGIANATASAYVSDAIGRIRRLSADIETQMPE